MSLEQKLRDNLKVAARALEVPEPSIATTPRMVPGRRNGVWFALGAAAVVIVLAVPALLLSSRGLEPETGGGLAGTSPESTVPPSLAPPTSTTPISSTTVPNGPGVVLAETAAGDQRLVLRATRIAEDLPTAAITLEAVPAEGGASFGNLLVGVPGEFFWNTVTEEGAVCDFSTREAGEVTEVSVEILLSASMGCSDPFVFELVGKELTTDVAPDGVARQFVAAWDHDLTDHMAELAEADALEDAAELSPPAEPMFSYCEGAAGSTYCTFEVTGGELVIRVRNEPPLRVIEVISIED